MHYWLAKQEHIYLLTVYAKGTKDDLTAAERDARRRAGRVPPNRLRPSS